MELPDVSAAGRAATGQMVWERMLLMVDPQAPTRTLGRALHAYDIEPPMSVIDLLETPGVVSPLSMNQAIDRVWPQIANIGVNGPYDPEDRESLAALGMRQKISAYLRGTVNAVCLEGGNPYRPSVWWVSLRWRSVAVPDSRLRFRRSVRPAHGANNGSEPEDIELRLREENRQLQAKIARLERKVTQLSRSLLLLTETEESGS